MTPRVGGAVRRRTSRDLARADVEDGLPTVGGSGLGFGGGGAERGRRWGGSGHREEGALVGFRVADERCDVVVR